MTEEQFFNGVAELIRAHNDLEYVTQPIKRRGSNGILQALMHMPMMSRDERWYQVTLEAIRRKARITHEQLANIIEEERQFWKLHPYEFEYHERCDERMISDKCACCRTSDNHGARICAKCSKTLLMIQHQRFGEIMVMPPKIIVHSDDRVQHFSCMMRQ